MLYIIDVICSSNKQNNVWGLAFTMYSVIMGQMGEALVAANSVVTVARNIFSVVGFGIAYGGAIILGKTIGAGKLEKAREDASKLVKISAISGIIGGLLLIIVRPIILNIVNLSELSTHYLNIMLWINSYYIVGQILNTCAICGVFRAGGDSKFGFIIDTIFMWIIMVPIGLLCGFYWKLPPMIVYFILCCDEFIKYPIVYFHYKRGKWLKDITRNFNSKMEGV